VKESLLGSITECKAEQRSAVRPRPFDKVVATSLPTGR
jgi:hypothetical protein